MYESAFVRYYCQLLPPISTLFYYGGTAAAAAQPPYLTENIEDDNKIENKLEYKMKIYFISSH